MLRLLGTRLSRGAVLIHSLQFGGDQYGRGAVNPTVGGFRTKYPAEVLKSAGTAYLECKGLHECSDVDVAIQNLHA